MGGLRRILGRRRAPSSSARPPEDAEPIILPEGLGEQIAAAQNIALEIYHQHGLPTEEGSYVRRGPNAAWEKLPDNLTPAEKWELLSEAPLKAGWRFVVRAALGRHSEFAEVQRAAYLLMACDTLMAKLKGHSPATPQDVADAMQLASATALLTSPALQQPVQAAPVEPHSPLMFLPVPEGDTKPQKPPHKRKKP